MGKHYVIGDVHGCFHELMDLLNVISSKDSDASICFVGDFLDRGPDVDKVLKWMMEHVTLDGKYQCVRGNHEEMVLEWYREWKKWMYRGGASKKNDVMPETAFEFSRYARKINLLSMEQLNPIMKFLESLPYYKTVSVQGQSGKEISYKIAHAWYTENVPEVFQKGTMLWSRDTEKNNDDTYIIVHGHTPTIDSSYYTYEYTSPGLIGYRKGAINVDGGCCFSDDYGEFYPCMLCAICLETLEEIYPYGIEKRMRLLNDKRYTDNEINEIIEKYMRSYTGYENRHRRAMKMKINS